MLPFHHSVSKNLPPTALHGIVGALSVKDNWLITSPNMNWVPEYPYIEHNTIIVRSDGRWGIAEYSRWPQVYSDVIPHHACIPSEPKGSRPHPYYTEYQVREPDRSVFDKFTVFDWTERPECGVAGMGYANRELLNRLVTYAFALYEDTTALKISALSLQKQLGAHIRQLIERLRHIPMVFQQTLVTFSHLQRLTLELHGLFNYYKAYAPAYESGMNNSKRVFPFRGAFTSNPEMAEDFYRAGVPVWVLQNNLPTVRLLKKVEFTGPYAPGLLEDEESFPRVRSQDVDKRARNFNTVPGEWPGQVSRIIMEFTCSTKFPLLPYVAPVTHFEPKRLRVDTTTTPSTMTPPSTSTTLPVTKSKHSRGHRAPPKNPPLPPAPYQIFRYEEAAHLPRITQNWSEIATSLSPTATPPPNLAPCYYYPPLFLIENIADSKSVRYCHNYLCIREFLSARLLSSDIEGQPLKIKDWRVALWGDYRIEDTHGQDKKADLRAQDKRTTIRNLFALNGNLLSYTSDVHPTFNNIQISEAMIMDTDHYTRLILWEIREVNFRCEVRALDAVILGSDKTSGFLYRDRLTNLSRIWGSINGGDCVVPTWENTDPAKMIAFWTPAGAAGWKKRRQCFADFVKFMRGWFNFPELLLQNLDGIAKCEDEEKFDEYEKVAIRFYCTTFISYFHRMPTIPAMFPL